MTFFHTIILGIIQGLGEFLPISSSGHLYIIPWLLGWADHGLTFDIALHFGTAVAILIYFRRDWVRLIRAFFRLRPNKEQILSNPDQKLVVLLILATIPGAIIGLLLEKHAETAFRNPLLVGAALAIMGVILWWTDQRGKKSKSVATLSIKDALLIGIAQGLAVIPGVSRAGSTISAGLLLGLGREAAARFSFFMAMPIILGACILKLRHLTLDQLTLEFNLGVLIAGVTGYLAIGGLIRFVQTRSYLVFAYYRVALGALVWIVYFVR